MEIQMRHRHARRGHVGAMPARIASGPKAKRLPAATSRALKELEAGELER
jgi:hypothetical protein